MKIELEHHIILGSQSPRRNQLIKQLGFKFKNVSIETDESFPADLAPVDVPGFLASKKAKTYLNLLDENSLLITADTVVVLGNKILEKPKNRAEAIEMISDLSGNQHEVITGVCLTTKNNQEVFHDITKVFFKRLNAPTISYYVDKYQPFDKAGGYGIQEWIGMIGIERIEGCYYNVMGLPTPLLFEKIFPFSEKSKNVN